MVKKSKSSLLKILKNPHKISESEAMVAQYQTDVAECESKLQELLTKLPLESRRGYEEPQPEPEPEVESEPQPEENQDDQN